MLSALLIGSALTVVNLAILVMAVLLILRRLLHHLEAQKQPEKQLKAIGILAIVVTGLFVGHLLQFASWALLFLGLGEFSDFQTAFYHSAVNFASLGYGDIVMSDRWRLLGALEATNGVLMLGLSAGTILSVMHAVLSRHELVVRVKERM
jgi:hypothetical protein